MEAILKLTHSYLYSPYLAALMYEFLLHDKSCSSNDLHNIASDPHNIV